MNEHYVAEKIIGVVILLIAVTIITVVLAFETVFVWTYPVPRQTFWYDEQAAQTPTQ